MPTHSPLFASVVADTELMAELNGRMKKLHADHAELLESNEVELPMAGMKAVAEGKMLDDADAQSFAEAIVLVDGRPSLLVRNDRFDAPSTTYWKSRLDPYRETLAPVLQSVGRVELTGHPTYEWVGTGWVIGDRLIATNRHVAMVFAQRGGAGFVFRRSPLGAADMTARIDFKEEYLGGSADAEVAVARVLFIAPDSPGQPDLAVLELTDAVASPPPLRLAASSRVAGPVAAVGYPAYDSRNGEAAMRKVFADIYDVKRFAPGFLMPEADPNTLRHNCSTLGGNSGSAVIEVGTGQVIGLHFGGQFKTANYAVKAEVLRGVLAGLPATRPVLPPTADEPEASASFADRDGYRPDFLGSGKRVKLPTLSAAQEEDATPVPGRHDFVLTYRHFSVVMCASRRLCYFTAVNIDGNQSVNLRRTGSWGFDPRIPRAAQAGDDLYGGNQLDRGHMVRRLDPVWGTAAVAKQANNDTFMFTNSCPQRDQLNQGIWNDLEDYILNSANEENLKVSVFTGPVFSDADPTYRGYRLPLDFWKVAVMVKANGKLSATAYMQTQKNLLGDLDELPGFAFGAFRTYQVPVARVERLTDLSFGTLASFDPLAGQEGVGPADPREIRGASDLIL